MKYRSEIDGLRAIAVASVVLFHAGIHRLAGGLTGVDVFFVISGYLICSLIDQEIAAGEFSLLRFYERRARRILPALFAVMFFVAAVAPVLMSPGQFRELCWSMLACLGFVSNQFFQSAGEQYSSQTLHATPLLHSWSLAVEEQFYVLFPPLFYAAGRLGQRWLTGAMVALCCASFLLLVLWSKSYSGAAFFLLPSRAWEIGAGVVLALTWRGEGHVPARIASIAALGGALLIAFALLAPITDPVWPRLLAVTGAALIIAFAGNGTLIGRLLAASPLIALGKISYSVYLWHWPLFELARLAAPASHWVIQFLAVLSVVLGYLSWRYVEQPFRAPGRVPRNQLALGLAGAGAVLCIYASLGVLMPERMISASPAARKIMAISDERKLFRDDCFRNTAHAASPEVACRFGTSIRPAAIVWGDSHGVMLTRSLAQTLPAGIPVLQWTRGHCPPVPGFKMRSDPDGCAVYNDRARALLAAGTPVTAVVLVAAWSIYEADAAGGEAGRRALWMQFQAEVGRLLAHGIRTVIVYPEPLPRGDIPAMMLRQLRYGHGTAAPLTTDYADYKHNFGSIIAAFDAIPDHPLLVRLRPDEYLCPRAEPRRCLEQSGGAPLYMDHNHLSSVADAMIARRIVQELSMRDAPRAVPSRH